jgi:hypothetical protein
MKCARKIVFLLHVKVKPAIAQRFKIAHGVRNDKRIPRMYADPL